MRKRRRVFCDAVSSHSNKYYRDAVLQLTGQKRCTLRGITLRRLHRLPILLWIPSAQRHNQLFCARSSYLTNVTPLLHSGVTVPDIWACLQGRRYGSEQCQDLVLITIQCRKGIL